MAGSIALSLWFAALLYPFLSCRRGLSSEKLHVHLFHSCCPGVTQTPHGGVASTLEDSGSPAPDFMLQIGMTGITVTLAHKAFGSGGMWAHWWHWEEPIPAMGALICSGLKVTLTSTVAPDISKKLALWMIFYFFCIF